jgi:hypothetical protein
MLPIVGKDVEGQKVSIYIQAVQAKHPPPEFESREKYDHYLANISD